MIAITITNNRPLPIPAENGKHSQPPQLASTFFADFDDDYWIYDNIDDYDK